MKFVSFFDPKNEIDFVSKFRGAAAFAIILPLVSIIGMVVLDINWGIDFSGGTELQVQFQQPLESKQLHGVLDNLGFSKTQVQRYGSAENNEWLIRVERMETFTTADVDMISTLIKGSFPQSKGNEATVRFNPDLADRLEIQLDAKEISDSRKFEAALTAQKSKLAALLDEKSGFRLRRTKGIGSEIASINEAILEDEPKDGRVTYTAQFMGVSDKIGQALTSAFGKAEIRKVDFVDSQVSEQLRTDGLLALILALGAMLIYIWVRFDLFFSPGAIVGLVHDTLGAMVVFVFFRYEFDLPSVAALLTIVGYSINSTIVIYDRIREIVPPVGGKKEPPYELLRAGVNKAVNDTLSRTINTSITTLFATVALAILGGGVIASFAFALSIGIVLGAFASTFIAPATYLFLRKNYSHVLASSVRQAHSREDRARGIV